VSDELQMDYADTKWTMPIQKDVIAGCPALPITCYRHKFSAHKQNLRTLVVYNIG